MIPLRNSRIVGNEAEFDLLEEDEEVQVLEPEQMMVPISFQHILELVKKRRSDIRECIGDVGCC
jgi:hypothetical protein